MNDRNCNERKDFASRDLWTNLYKDALCHLKDPIVSFRIDGVIMFCTRWKISL